MTDATEPTADDEREQHRRWGVAFNNAVWDALDAGLTPQSPQAERTRVLYTAYASARHWLDAGTVAHEARGEYLVAKVALAIGLPDVALRHARRCVELVQTHADAMEDWDSPFAHEALARALAATGDLAGAREHWRRSEDLAAAVADEEDREILTTERAREPRPW